MGKPLFKAPDGGYYEIVRVTEGAARSGLRQGLDTSVLVEQKVRPEAFPSGLLMSVMVGNLCNIRVYLRVFKDGRVWIWNFDFGFRDWVF